jgi:hypothetical protein
MPTLLERAGASPGRPAEVVLVLDGLGADRNQPGFVSIIVSRGSGRLERRGEHEGLDARARLDDVGDGAVAVARDLVLARSFGLKLGWLTIASTSPVCTSSTITEPARARCGAWRLQLAVGEVLDAQVDAQRRSLARPRRGDALDVLDDAAEPSWIMRLRPSMPASQWS